MNERGYSVRDVLWLIAAVVALWVAVSVFTRIVSGRLQRATGAPRGALQPMAMLVKYGLIFVGLIVILLVECGIIHHVLDEHPFRDGNYFYRFYADEPAPV